MSFLFDPEFNLYLQSFQNPLLTWFMLIVSALGSKEVLLTAAASVFLSVDSKKGFVLLQMVFWSILLTTLLKELFGLPRPPDVNPLVLRLDGFYPAIPQKNNPGFPSGHVMSTVTFWILLAHFYPKRVLRVLAILFICLMPVSRMYLGRHFLADVLGGLVIGALISIIGIFFWKHCRLSGFYPSTSRIKLSFFAYFILLPLLLNFIPLFQSDEIGFWFGVNCFTFWALLQKAEIRSGRPLGSWQKFVIAAGLYFVIFWCYLSLVY